jgi:uncharacterized membrane protein
MSTSNDNTSDKIHPKASSISPLELLIWTIIVMQVIIAVVAYPFLPPIVPIHWGANGQVNGYGSKLILCAMFPLLSLGVYGLLRVLLGIGPRLGSRANLASNLHLGNILSVGILLFMLIIQLVIIANGLGISTDIGSTFVISLGISLLFIFVGNYLGKVRRNFWMGIRTPWTITSDIVWERTHRLGGWLFVASGLLGIPLSFVPEVRVWGITVSILLVSAFLVVYSYVCYRQNVQSESEPLSPPFGEE